MPLCFEEKNMLRISLESLSSNVGKQQFPNKYFNCIHKNETICVFDTPFFPSFNEQWTPIPKRIKNRGKTLGKYPGKNTKLHIQAKQSALAFGWWI